MRRAFCRLPIPKDAMTLTPVSKLFSLRLTHEERARLEHEAGSLSLSAYVRLRLFGSDSAPRKVRSKHAIKDHAALGRVLGLLGASDLAANLKAIATAAKTGELPITADTEITIQAACADIRAMHAALMTALGFRSGDQS